MTGDSFLMSARNDGYIKPKDIILTGDDPQLFWELDEAVSGTNINNLFITDYGSFPFSWLDDGETIMCCKKTGKRVMICK